MNEKLTKTAANTDIILEKISYVDHKQSTFFKPMTQLTIEEDVEVSAKLIETRHKENEPLQSVSAQVSPERIQHTQTRLWYDEIDALYKGTETARKYRDYNLKFQSWFSEKYGLKAVVEERHAREFVTLYITAGKSTKILISALKFRFNECEKSRFSFKGLNKKSETQKPHQAISREQLQVIFDQLKKYPEI